jgi:hypothetical protein
MFAATIERIERARGQPAAKLQKVTQLWKRFARATNGPQRERRIIGQQFRIPLRQPRLAWLAQQQGG